MIRDFEMEQFGVQKRVSNNNSSAKLGRDTLAPADLDPLLIIKQGQKEYEGIPRVGISVARAKIGGPSMY